MLTLPDEGLIVPTSATSSATSECETRRDHQSRCRDQQPALIDPRAQQADGQRHRRRAEQRQRRDQSDLEGTEPHRCQIGRQQHGDETVAEIAQRARRIQIRGRVRLRHLSEVLDFQPPMHRNLHPKRLRRFPHRRFTREADVREGMIVEVPQGPALPLPFDPAVNPARHLSGRPPHYVRGARQLGGAPHVQTLSGP